MLHDLPITAVGQIAGTAIWPTAILQAMKTGEEITVFGSYGDFFGEGNQLCGCSHYDLHLTQILEVLPS